MDINDDGYNNIFPKTITSHPLPSASNKSGFCCCIVLIFIGSFLNHNASPVHSYIVSKFVSWIKSRSTKSFMVTPYDWIYTGHGHENFGYASGYRFYIECRTPLPPHQTSPRCWNPMREPGLSPLHPAFRSFHKGQFSWVVRMYGGFALHQKPCMPYMYVSYLCKWKYFWESMVLGGRSSVDELLHTTNHSTEGPGFLVNQVTASANLWQLVECIDGSNQILNARKLQVMTFHDLQQWFENWCIELHIVIVCFDEAARLILTSSRIEFQEQILVVTYAIPDDWWIIPLDWHSVQAIASNHWFWWILGTRWFPATPTRSPLGWESLRSHAQGLCFGHGAPTVLNCQSQKRSAQDMRNAALMTERGWIWVVVSPFRVGHEWAQEWELRCLVRLMSDYM